MTWTIVYISGLPSAAFPSRAQAEQWLRGVLDTYRQLPHGLWPSFDLREGMLIEPAESDGRNVATTQSGG